MAQLKALAVIFHSLDLTFDGKRYTDQINPPGTTDDFLGKAKIGLSKLPGRLKAMNPNVNLTITPYDSYNPKVLRELNLEEYRDNTGKITTRRPFIQPSNFERIMKLTDPSFSLSWGQYDTIFVIVPYTNPGMVAWQQANPTVHGLPGLALYSAGQLKGAAIAFLPANWDLSKFDGDGLQHEWLHGVSQFYKFMGWKNLISDKDVDEGGDRGYSENKTPTPGQWGGWGDFYVDFMNGSVANNKAAGNTPLSAKPGITNALWNGGTMAGDITNLFKDNGFKTAYQNAGGRNNVGIPASDIHDWGSVTIMDFRSNAGDTAILRLKGTTAAFFLPNKWWLKYVALGGESIGAPINAVHDWAGGKIIDLKKANGTTSAMMSTDNGTNIWHLFTELWTKYKAVGGAPSIGYPKSDWHAWGKGKIMDFIGTAGYACGIMKSDSGSKYCLVKGLIWKAYTATAGNGATSYLGYPTSDEYTWRDGLFGWFGTEYYRQDFQGGWCWASKTNASKFGNDKNFSTNK